MVLPMYMYAEKKRIEFQIGGLAHTTAERTTSLDGILCYEHQWQI